MHIEFAQEHLRVGKIPSLHFLCFRAWTVFSPTVPAFALKPSLLLRSLQPFFFSSLCSFALAYSTLLFATPFPSSLSATLLLLFFYPSLFFSSLLLFALFYLSRLFFVLLFSSLHSPHYPALLCSSLCLSFLHASIL